MIRFHNLRHTAALLMLNPGIPMNVVPKILGQGILLSFQPLSDLFRKTSSEVGGTPKVRGGSLRSPIASL